MRLTRAEITLTALRENLEGIRRKVGQGVRIMGIVKANGYGHGMVEISRALVSFGIDYLGVGFLEEGIFLREKGVRIPILVLGGVLGNQVRQFLEYDLDITVSSWEIAERIEREVQETNNSRARVHLKVDTGMERIGVHAEGARHFIETVCRLPHLEPVGIYSHFASSDAGDKTFAFEQLERFTALLETLGTEGIEFPLTHMANSGAILDLPQSYFTMVRPGIMLYGVFPTKETSLSVPLSPVLSLKSKVVYVKEVPKGRSISYGRAFITSKKTRIATVPVGYGDGYPWRLTNNAEVLIQGKRFRVVGAVCMDQLMIDLGDDTTIHVGDDVVLIGRDGAEEVTVTDLASGAGTIPYEILTGIAARVPRYIIH